MQEGRVMCPPHLMTSCQGRGMKVVDVTDFNISPELQQSSEHGTVVFLCCQVQGRPEMRPSRAVGLWEDSSALSGRGSTVW